MTQGERGQASLLIVGLAIVLILLTGVVVDASAAYLQRQSLSTLADGAALAGANEVEGDPAYSGGLGEHVPIDPALARGAVADYFREIGAYADLPGLDFRVSVRDRSVVVHVRAPLDLPITVDGVTDTTVSAVGSAAVVVVE
jgi:hypothetical protein